MLDMKPDSAREPASATALTIAVHFLMLVLSLLAVSSLQGVPALFGVNLPFWILVIAWVLALPFFLLRSLNVATMRAFGAKPATVPQAPNLERLWHQVLKRAGVPSDRYRLLIVADEQPSVGKDAGWHVVTVSQLAVDELSWDEMTAILAQRLGRHAGINAAIFSLALWIALPVVLWLGIGWLVWRLIKVLRGLSRGFHAAGDAVNPKTEGQAAVGLAFYLIGLACLLVIACISIILVIPAAVAVMGVLVLRAIERWHEYHADQFAVRLGYGPQLVSALSQLRVWEEPRGPLQRIFSPFPTIEARLRKLS